MFETQLLPSGKLDLSTELAESVVVPREDAIKLQILYSCIRWILTGRILKRSRNTWSGRVLLAPRVASKPVARVIES